MITLHSLKKSAIYSAVRNVLHVVETSLDLPNFNIVCHRSVGALKNVFISFSVVKALI